MKEEDEVDIENLECTCCGGEGWFVGSDAPGFDYINDDPNGVYPCNACRGSGKREDQTLF